MRLSVDQLVFARKLRRMHTDAERRLWYQLRGRRFLGLHFRRQHPIGPYFADFACLELKVVIELDGGQHNTPGGQMHDGTRSDVLAAHDFQVIRFWDNDVLQRTPVVLEAMRQALAIRKAALTRARRATSPNRLGEVKNPNRSQSRSSSLTCP